MIHFAGKCCEMKEEWKSRIKKKLRYRQKGRDNRAVGREEIIDE